jgi:two-component system, chemotaxis family, chemotaxis protein CheY
MPTALVVDDSRAIRMILTRMLSDYGYEVLQAGDGRQALSALSEKPDVSLAMVDWNMPEMNGLEFVQQVRADQSRAGLRIVMVTTETQMDQMVTALEAGADEYVMKPFNKEIIEDKLRLIGVIQ